MTPAEIQEAFRVAASEEIAPLSAAFRAALDGAADGMMPAIGSTGPLAAALTSLEAMISLLDTQHAASCEEHGRTEASVLIERTIGHLQLARRQLLWLVNA